MWWNHHVYKYLPTKLEISPIGNFWNMKNSTKLKNLVSFWWKSMAFHWHLVVGIQSILTLPFTISFHSYYMTSSICACMLFYIHHSGISRYYFLPLLSLTFSIKLCSQIADFVLFCMNYSMDKHLPGCFCN